MTTRLLKNPPGMIHLDGALRQYSVLKARVHEVLILGRRHIEKEFMRMRYHTGLLINEHVRLNGERADYGAEAVLRLEKDFDIDHTELNRYAQLAKSYPIGGGRRQLDFNLPWSHYRKLMTIKNDELRYELTTRAEKNGWSFEEVETKVRDAVGKENDQKEPSRLPMVCLGPFHTYKIIRPETIRPKERELVLDLGFSHRKEMNLFPGVRYAAETIVTSTRDSRGHYSVIKVEGAREDILFTYKAFVEKVIDGDTLKLDFRLGFGDRRGETIRLNHIDCPELDTPEGRAAKRFVESQLADCEFITVKSTQTRKEKWGRYLGDVFYTSRHSRANADSPVAPIYLNQLLLDKGHAVRVRR